MTLKAFVIGAVLVAGALGVRHWWRKREAEQTRRNNLRMYGDYR